MNEDRRCVASNRAGERCRLPSIPGGSVCRFHGGGAPQVQAAAARRLVEAEARSILDRLEAPKPLGHPVEELLALGAEVRAWLSILRERVGDPQRLDTTDRAGVEHERALVALYERALDRAYRLLSDLAKLGLAERIVRMSEDEAQLVVELLDGVLSEPELGLSGAQVTTFRRVVAVRARALAAGDAA